MQYLVLTTALADMNGEVKVKNFADFSLGVTQRKATIFETLSGVNIAQDCGYSDDRKTISFSFTNPIYYKQLKELLANHGEFDIHTFDGVYRGILVLTHNTNNYTAQLNTFEKLT